MAYTSGDACGMPYKYKFIQIDLLCFFKKKVSLHGEV